MYQRLRRPSTLHAAPDGACHLRGLRGRHRCQRNQAEDGEQKDKKKGSEQEEGEATNRQEVTQYQASGVGVVAGADLNFRQPPEAPCRDCGRMVDLSAEITVNIVQPDGSEANNQMSEANARALLTQVGIGSPPVLCDQHAWVENEVVLPRG